VVMASWPTPTHGDRASTGAAGYSTESGRHSGTTLTDAARASWPTPTARDFKSESATDEFNAKRWGHPRGKPLSAEATLASGPTSNGSPAATAKPGQLSPDFSRWLMGYSAEHLSCAPTEMPSSRKSRPSS
jgi:hypothetical protein